MVNAIIAIGIFNIRPLRITRASANAASGARDYVLAARIHGKKPQTHHFAHVLLHYCGRTRRAGYHSVCWPFWPRPPILSQVWARSRPSHPGPRMLSEAQP